MAVLTVTDYVSPFLPSVYVSEQATWDCLFRDCFLVSSARRRCVRVLLLYFNDANME